MQEYLFGAVCSYVVRIRLLSNLLTLAGNFISVLRLFLKELLASWEFLFQDEVVKQEACQ